MPARGTTRKSTKTPRRRPKKARLIVSPMLTSREIRQIQARAAEDMRSLGNYVALLVIEDLERPAGGRRQRGRVPPPGGRRVSYSIGAPLTAAQRAEFKARATDQVRSVSSYVARLIVNDLGRG